MASRHDLVGDEYEGSVMGDGLGFDLAMLLILVVCYGVVARALWNESKKLWESAEIVNEEVELIVGESLVLCSSLSFFVPADL